MHTQPQFFAGGWFIIPTSMLDQVKQTYLWECLENHWWEKVDKSQLGSEKSCLLQSQVYSPIIHPECGQMSHLFLFSVTVISFTNQWTTYCHSFHIFQWDSLPVEQSEFFNEVPFLAGPFSQPSSYKPLGSFEFSLTLRCCCELRGSQEQTFIW